MRSILGFAPVSRAAARPYGYRGYSYFGYPGRPRNHA